MNISIEDLKKICKSYDDTYGNHPLVSMLPGESVLSFILDQIGEEPEFISAEKDDPPFDDDDGSDKFFNTFKIKEEDFNAALCSLKTKEAIKNIEEENKLLLKDAIFNINAGILSAAAEGKEHFSFSTNKFINYKVIDNETSNLIMEEFIVYYYKKGFSLNSPMNDYYTIRWGN